MNDVFQMPRTEAGRAALRYQLDLSARLGCEALPVHGVDFDRVAAVHRRRANAGPNKDGGGEAA